MWPLSSRRRAVMLGHAGRRLAGVSIDRGGRLVAEAVDERGEALVAVVPAGADGQPGAEGRARGGVTAVDLEARLTVALDHEARGAEAFEAGVELAPRRPRGLDQVDRGPAGRGGPETEVQGVDVVGRAPQVD